MRKAEEEYVVLALISFLTPIWIEELKNSYQLSIVVNDIVSKLQQGFDGPRHYSMHHGQWLRKGKMVLIPNSPFKAKVLQHIYSDP